MPHLADTGMLKRRRGDDEVIVATMPWLACSRRAILVHPRIKSNRDMMGGRGASR